jgi:hypothetical protein
MAPQPEQVPTTRAAVIKLRRNAAKRCNAVQCRGQGPPARLTGRWWPAEPTGPSSVLALPTSGTARAKPDGRPVPTAATLQQA